MDENSISVLCCISACDWRVVGDTRCQHHGGLPVYSWLPSIWGDPREDDIEAMRPELLITHPPEKGATNG